jgi:hypothetical protein
MEKEGKTKFDSQILENDCKISTNDCQFLEMSV